MKKSGNVRREEKAGHRKQIERLEKDNRDLSVKVVDLSSTIEEQKKKIEDMSSESRGTRGEIHLLDMLQSAFLDDKLTPKIVGVEMADVIQIVVTENGEKIVPPIVWDRKTSDKVTPKDICKAKNYKTKHNTDYSVIVTESGITTKDSHNTVFGMREGIYLVHPTAVVDIARIFRSFIIESAKLSKSNKGRTSKHARLYDYLKSPEYARTIEMTRDANTKLDELQRKEENYHKETWTSRKKFLDEWRKICEQNQQKINDIIQDTSEDSQDEDKKGEE